MRALAEVEVSTTLGLPAMFILLFHDNSEGLTLINSDTFKLGKTVQVDLADAAGETTASLLKGEITAIEPDFSGEGVATLSVRGFDKSHRLNRETKIKTFLNMSDSDLVKKIAQEGGLSVTATDTAEVHEHVYQDNVTDLAFLHELAQRNGFEVFVGATDEKLYFRKPEGSAGEVTLEWAASGQLISFHPRVTVAKQVSEVTVKGWDPQKKEAIIGQASSSGISPQIGFGWGGSEVSSAFSDAKRVEVRRPVASQSEADTIAQAILDRINSGFIEADGVAYGNPELSAGKKVTLRKLGSKFDGTYLITSATHTLPKDGAYETRFTVEGAHHQLLADLVDESSALDEMTTYWGGVVPAIVTNNNSDEKDWGRVKVKFPWMADDHESAWARIVGFGGGTERGIYFLPEIDDEVLVAFEHGDFNRPYIIGGLWNGQDAPPGAVGEVVADGNVEKRIIKTRVGHHITLTDKSGEEKIEIVSGDGTTHITMDIANQKITIESPKEVEILGSSNKMTIDQSNKITVEATGDIDIKATGNLNLKGMAVKVEAQGTLDLTASGPTTVKGAVVNIN
jgi:uncharacterized protein involved in type VI secretion and phage assembly